MEDLPKHVKKVRQGALSVLVIAEVWLVGGPPLWLALGDAKRYVSEGIDTSDWIAVAAVVIAAVGIWFARRSAKAAEYSADIAAKALGIAESAAQSSSISARAAEKSADADIRAVAVAEAAQHRELAPKWTVEADAPENGTCVVRLCYTEGPNQVAVDAWISGTVWEQETEDDGARGLVVGKTFKHDELHPSEEWEICVTFRRDLQAVRMEGIITVLSRDVDVDIHGDGEESEFANRPWVFNRFFKSEQVSQASVRWTEA